MELPRPLETGMTEEQLLASLAHYLLRNNPHGITAEQIGAAAASALTSHTGNTNNPHDVTAEQVGTYTKAQVDASLESLAGFGDALASDADVNNIKTIGRYRVTSSAAAETITNIPTNVAGALLVLPSSTANNTRLVQIYIPNWATTNQIGILYIRQLLSGGWGDWYKIGDTTPTAIGSSAAGAINVTNVNDLPKRDAEYYTLTSTETARLTNIPSGITGCVRIEVKFITGGAAAERCVQVLYATGVNGFFQREYGSSGWSAWYRFEGTVVS